MEIEIRLEGAVIRGAIERAPVFLTEHPGPGLILLGQGSEGIVKAYQKALVYDASWNPDVHAMNDAKFRLRQDPAWRGEIERIEAVSRGQANVERWMLLDLRCVGEPFMLHVERREMEDSSIEWGLVGSASTGRVRAVSSLGIWLPDASMYDEMEQLARVYAAGTLTRQHPGVYFASLKNGSAKTFVDRDDALAWMGAHASHALRSYTPREQAMALSAAAWDRAQAGLDRVNSIINMDTYTAVARLVDRNGNELCERTEGHIGEASAKAALFQLIEQLHPTAFPMPRMH